MLRVGQEQAVESTIKNNKMQIMTDMACDTDGPGLF